MAVLLGPSTQQPDQPLERATGWLVIDPQAVPCFVTAVLLVADLAFGGRNRPVRLLGDIATGILAWLIIAFGSFLAYAELPLGLPSFVVGAGLLGCLFAGWWVRLHGE